MYLFEFQFCLDMYCVGLLYHIVILFLVSHWLHQLTFLPCVGRFPFLHTSLTVVVCRLFFFFFSWRLITLQYCSGFCHPLTRISHGFTCIPHPDPPSHLPLHLIPLGLPSAPGPSSCLMHPTWADDLFHPR